MFESRVLPVSEDVMFKWRLLVETGRKAGPLADLGWEAAQRYESQQKRNKGN